MGNKSQTTTSVQKADPWKGAQSGLKTAIGDAGDLYDAGGFAPDPYSGPRIADRSAATMQGQQMMLDAANSGMPLSGQASGALSQMMDAGWQSDQLDAVKNEALGSAIPAAVAQFAGAGMTNSSAAMDTVGRAAAQAVAPYEYDAFNNMQTNALRASAFAPSLDQASYLPSQMVGQVGAAQDAYSQALTDAGIQSYYEGANQGLNNLTGYADLMMAMGGMGGTSSGSTTTPGASFAQTAGGSLLGGMGTYGALAANPVTAPFAAAGGIASGLLGLF